ncbi:23S rRNA (guanosine(2251)-2'-O)-methyltransferase RlmB [Calycomorphotria hydatis]|uniref:23S rRNA (Guanosine-2'-O-)-methyltransferase RlmB n=1 Tax=Calycomorphotria hydatis TaxID=2528027 RepID=A0A517TDA6_9PLAN|nr:RNA methyltransferase [Calycomorphotria hydatis]QDT66351.1 23S rRNA (guanosine-2'-O-)-methyltransferase RlmB [Calycomorphotria hydatis]
MPIDTATYTSRPSLMLKTLKMLTLRNPHSVLAALKSRPHDVTAIILRSAKPHGSWVEVADLARSERIAVRSESAERAPKKQHKNKEERVGVAEAMVKERTPIDHSRFFTSTKNTEANKYGLWLALDQVQDPHNVGAVFRTAGFFGVRGIVITRDRSAPLSATAYDTACGGVESVPFCQPPNLARSIKDAKEAGLWVLGTSEHAEQDVFDVPRDRDWLLVLGNEEKGLRRLTTEHCDTMCRLTPQGEVTSLNVSSAAAALVAVLSRG